MPLKEVQVDGYDTGDDWSELTINRAAATWIPSADYCRAVDLLPICCVDVLIIRRNAVLLVRRRDEPQARQLWLPGGRLRKGEPLSSCAVRQAREEVGLEIGKPRPLGVAGTLFATSAHGARTTHTVNVTFSATVVDETVEPRLDRAHSEYVWWPVSRRLPHPYLRRWATCLESDDQEAK